MDKENYVKEALTQLDNKKYYQPLTGPIFQDTIEPVKKILIKLEDRRYITTKQRKYL